MRRARPEELKEDAKPVALLRLSKDRLEELFPVELSEVDLLRLNRRSVVWSNSKADRLRS